MARTRGLLAHRIDLNPLDFYLWSHMKNVVYATDIASDNELRQRIFAAALKIRNTERIFERVCDNWKRRVRACMETGGRHFEHLL